MAERSSSCFPALRRYLPFDTKDAGQQKAPLSWKTVQCALGTITILGGILVIGGGAGLLNKTAMVVLGAGATGTAGIGCIVNSCYVRNLLGVKQRDGVDIERPGSTGEGVGLIAMHSSGEHVKDHQIASLEIIIGNLTQKLFQTSSVFQRVLVRIYQDEAIPSEFTQAQEQLAASISSIKELLPKLHGITQVSSNLHPLDLQFTQNIVIVERTLLSKVDSLKGQIADLHASFEELNGTARKIQESLQVLDRLEATDDRSHLLHNHTAGGTNANGEREESIHAVRQLLNQSLTSQRQSSQTQEGDGLGIDLEEIARLTDSLKKATEAYTQLTDQHGTQ